MVNIESHGQLCPAVPWITFKCCGPVVDIRMYIVRVSSYTGHGNGSAYVAEDTLQQVPCRSVAILMGCSSGRLVAHGSLDASGTMLHYLVAGA